MDILVHQEKEHYVVYFEISVNGEEWQKQLQDSSELLQKHDKMPGYEDGNAPLSVVLEHRYDNLLRERAALRKMADNLPALISHFEYKPVSRPENTIISVTPEELRYSCTFVVMPDIKDLQYKGVVVEKPVRTCTEADIKTALKKYMHEHPALRHGDHKGHKHDSMRITFSGTVNGEPIEEGKTRSTLLELGKDEIFPGLDDVLIGHSAGDKVTAELAMPKNYKVHAIAGKTLALDITVDEVLDSYVPECTDEYCAQYAEDGVNTVEELKGMLCNRIQAELNDISNNLLEVRMEQALADLITCEVPQEMIETAYQKARQDMQQQATTRGTTIVALLKYQGITLEQFNKEQRELANLKVRQFLALDYIVRTGEVTYTREQVEAFYEMMAKNSGKSVAEWKEYYEGDAQVIEELLYANAEKLFRDNVIVKEVPVKAFPKH